MTTLNDTNYNNNHDYDDDRKRPISSMLTDRESIVQETMLMQKSTKESLEYLRKNGYSVSERTLRRDKESIKEKNLIRLYQIAKIDFSQSHMERIEKLRYIEREMWKDVEACQDPYKKLKMKESIANLQPIISSYLDATRYAIEKIYPNKRLDEEEEIENGNNDNYYPDIDGSRISRYSSSKDDYNDPPPTVF